MVHGVHMDWPGNQLVVRHKRLSMHPTPALLVLHTSLVLSME